MVTPGLHDNRWKGAYGGRGAAPNHPAGHADAGERAARPLRLELHEPAVAADRAATTTRFRPSSPDEQVEQTTRREVPPRRPRRRERTAIGRDAEVTPDVERFRAAHPTVRRSRTANPRGAAL